MPRIFFALITLFFVQGVVRAQSPHRDAVPIPSTISDEAQEFLRSMPSWEKRLAEARIPQSLEEWAQQQEEMDERFQVGNPQVEAAFVGRTEDREVNGVSFHVMTPKNFKEENSNRVLLYVHGGGYVFGSPEGALSVSAPVGEYAGLKVFSIRYRLAPQHRFPAAVDDCVEAYRAIIMEYGAENVAVFGHSSGGGLAVSMLLKAHREFDLPFPAALASLTPWSDVAKIGDSYYTLEGIEPILHYELMAARAEAYAGDTSMDVPDLSPAYADFPRDFPPTLIQTGTRDLLLSCSVRLHRKMKNDAVDVELSVFEGMWHGFQGIPNPFFPEAVEANREIADFLLRHLEEK